LRNGLISQATFPGEPHAGKIRSDVLGRQVRVEIDGRPHRGVAERLGERFHSTAVAEIGEATFARWWRNWCDRAHVTYRNPHVCRHTFATRRHHAQACRRP